MCEARGGGWITLYLIKRVIQGRARFLIHAKALRASRGLGRSQACVLLYKRRKPEGHRGAQAALLLERG